MAPPCRDRHSTCTRRRYTSEQRTQLIELVASGTTVVEAATRLGVGQSDWVVPVTWLMTVWAAPQVHKIEQDVASRDSPAQGTVPDPAASGLIDGLKQPATQRWPCSRQISSLVTPPAARSASYRPAHVRPER